MRAIKWMIYLSAMLMLLFAAAAQAQVTVGWDAYTDPRATEFKLYIATTPGGAATPIIVKPTTLTEYTIPAASMPGNKYYLRMTAFSATDNLESSPSNEVTWNRELPSPVNFRKKSP